MHFISQEVNALFPYYLLFHSFEGFALLHLVKSECFCWVGYTVDTCIYKMKMKIFTVSTTYKLNYDMSLFKQQDSKCVCVHVLFDRALI